MRRARHLNGGRRRKLTALQGGKCFYCGRKVYAQIVGLVPMADDHATFDHRVPLSRGGNNHGVNIVIACHACNQAKGTMTEIEFRFARSRAACEERGRDSADAS